MVENQQIIFEYKNDKIHDIHKERSKCKNSSSDWLIRRFFKQKPANSSEFSLMTKNKLENSFSIYIGKIARGIRILIKARGYFNNDCMKCLYYSFIYPYLMYCNHIWGNTYKTSLSKLQVLQNKAVRVITGSNPRTNTELINNKSGLLN